MKFREILEESKVKVYKDVHGTVSLHKEMSVKEADKFINKMKKESGASYFLPEKGKEYFMGNGKKEVLSK